MIGKKFLNWTLYGTIAGVLLACFFYGLEKIYRISLYTFLLNIDFLPLPDYILFHTPFQFILHVIIAIIITAFVDLVCLRFYYPYSLSISINVVMAFTFFPLYQVAVTKPFHPPLTVPFILWITGHLLFSFIIGYFVDLMHIKRSAE